MKISGSLRAFSKSLLPSLFLLMTATVASAQWPVYGTEFRFDDGTTKGPMLTYSGTRVLVRASTGVSGDAVGVASANYTSGWTGSGWQLDQAITNSGQSSMELDWLSVRGRLNVYELLVHQIRATNGSVFISNTGKVKAVSLAAGVYTLETETSHGFAANDIIRAQRWTGTGVYQSDLTVTEVTDDLHFKATLRAGGYVAPQKGFDYVRLGNTTDANRQGSIYLTADDTGAPYINVLAGVASWTDWGSEAKTQMRMGNLNGICGYATNTFGVCIGNASASWLKFDATNGVRGGYGATTAFYINQAGAAGFTGYVNITGGNAAKIDFSNVTAGYAGSPSVGGNANDTNAVNGVAAATVQGGAARANTGLNASGYLVTKVIPATAVSPSGAGLYLGSDYLGFYNGSAWRTYMDNAGRFYLGGPLGKLQWDGSVLSIEGYLTALGGSIGGWTISSDYLAKDTGYNASSAGMAPADWAYYAGATYANRASAPYRVYYDGSLYATNANIEGTITSSDGTIGGFTIADYWLYSGSGSTEAGMSVYGHGPAFYAGASDGTLAPFKVWHDGVMEAISGSIGGVSITSGALTGGVIEGTTVRTGDISYGSGTGCWMGDDGGTFKWRCGTAGNTRIFWDGTYMESWNQRIHNPAILNILQASLGYHLTYDPNGGGIGYAAGSFDELATRINALEAQVATLKDLVATLSNGGVK